MKTNQSFMTIKEAALAFGKSELTIRRLVKQNQMTNHVKTEDSSKGQIYLISKDFLQQQYQPNITTLVPQVNSTSELVQENERLKATLVEKDQTIQQLQNRIFEQSDVLNAMINQMNSQKISHIEELLISQNTQINELQQRLIQITNHKKSSWWKELFKRRD